MSCKDTQVNMSDEIITNVLSSFLEAERLFTMTDLMIAINREVVTDTIDSVDVLFVVRDELSDTYEITKVERLGESVYHPKTADPLKYGIVDVK